MLVMGFAALNPSYTTVAQWNCGGSVASHSLYETMTASKPFMHGGGNQRGRPVPEGRGAGQACVEYVVKFGLMIVRQI